MEIYKLEARLAARWLQALKTEDKVKKEEEEGERLVRKAPTLKPPRRDKSRTRIKEHDPDLSASDPDMSLHNRDARIAPSGAEDDGEELPRWRVLKPEDGRRNWLVVDDEGNRKYFPTEDEAETFLEDEIGAGEGEEEGEAGPPSGSKAKSMQQQKERQVFLERLRNAPLEAAGLTPELTSALRGDSHADWDASQIQDLVLNSSPAELFALRRELQSLKDSGNGATRPAAQEALQTALDEADKLFRKVKPFSEEGDLDSIFPPPSAAPEEEAEEEDEEDEDLSDWDEDEEGEDDEQSEEEEEPSGGWGPQAELVAKRALSLTTGADLAKLMTSLRSDAEDDAVDEYGKRSWASERAAQLLKLAEEETTNRAISSNISIGALASRKEDLLAGYIPGASDRGVGVQEALKGLDAMRPLDLEALLRDIPDYAVEAGLLNETDRLTSAGKKKVLERVGRDLELQSLLSDLRRAGGSDFEREVFGEDGLAWQGGNAPAPFQSPKHWNKVKGLLWEQRPSGLYKKLKSAIPARAGSSPVQIQDWFLSVILGVRDQSKTKESAVSSNPKNPRTGNRTTGRPLRGPLFHSPPDHSVPYPQPSPVSVSSPRRLTEDDFLDLFEDACTRLDTDPQCRAEIMPPEVACRIALDKTVWSGKYQHAVDAPTWLSLYRMLYLWREGVDPAPSKGAAPR